MSQINSNIKDDFQVVLLLSCFVGHPVYSCGIGRPLADELKLRKLCFVHDPFY